jgi:hypothetical protein
MTWSMTADTFFILGFVVLFVVFMHRDWYRVYASWSSRLALTALILLQLAVVIFGSRAIVATVLPLLVERGTSLFRISEFMVLFGTLLLTIRLGDYAKSFLLRRDHAFLR